MKTSPYVFVSSKIENEGSPYVFIGFYSGDHEITRGGGRATNPEKKPTHRNLSVSRSHTASHRTHERNETISRFGVD